MPTLNGSQLPGDPFLVWCSLKSKWVKPFLLNPYIIWPFLLVRAATKQYSSGGEMKGDRKGRGRVHFRLKKAFISKESI